MIPLSNVELLIKSKYEGLLEWQSEGIGGNCQRRVKV